MNYRGILERKHYERVICADGASVSIWKPPSPRGDADGDLDDACVCLNCGSVLDDVDHVVHSDDLNIISTLPRFDTAPTSPILWVRCDDCLACGIASAKKATLHIDDLPPRFQRDRDRGHFPTR